MNMLCAWFRHSTWSDLKENSTSTKNNIRGSNNQYVIVTIMEYSTRLTRIPKDFPNTQEKWKSRRTHNEWRTAGQTRNNADEQAIRKGQGIWGPEITGRQSVHRFWVWWACGFSDAQRIHAPVVMWQVSVEWLSFLILD